MTPNCAVPTADSEEQPVLDRIERETGLRFPHLASIATRHRALASAVLPILNDAIDSIQNGNLRGAIYLLFATKHSRPWIDNIIHWWTTEKDPINLSILTTVLSLVVDRKHATAVWNLTKTLPPRLGQYQLLASLSRFDAIAGEVKSHIMKQRDSLSLGDINDISRIKDDSIKECCRERKMALMGLSASMRGDRACAFIIESAARPPDRRFELDSVETDLRLVEIEVSDLFQRRGLLPPSVSGLAIQMVERKLDRWFRLKFAKMADGQPVIWLRLEDVDSIEIVLTKP